MAGEASDTGRIVWHELQTPDVDRAMRFYTKLFGWEIEVLKPEEADYPVICVGGVVHGGFQRMHPDSGIAPRWVPYVSVVDPDATAASARESGASVRVEPITIRDVGRLTFLVDPDGAEIAALARRPLRAAPEGVFVWDELHTEDVEAAGRTYAGIFGWTTDGRADAGYTVFQAGERPVAGLIRRPNTMPVPTWLPYIGTDDIRETLRRARELDAMVVDDVREMEGVGRYATIEDPSGSRAGLLESER